MSVILIGFGVTLGALVVQGIAVTVGVETIGALLAKRLVGIQVWRNGVATILFVTILLTGHLGQMAVWATAYMAAGEFDAFGAAFYHAAVNYTTLGYGDIVMSRRWRLLGPLEAANGSLMLGLSAAMLFTVMARVAEAHPPPTDG